MKKMAIFLWTLVLINLCNWILTIYYRPDKTWKNCSGFGQATSSASLPRSFLVHTPNIMIPLPYILPYLSEAPYPTCLAKPLFSCYSLLSRCKLHGRRRDLFQSALRLKGSRDCISYSTMRPTLHRILVGDKEGTRTLSSNKAVYFSLPVSWGYTETFLLFSFFLSFLFSYNRLPLNIPSPLHPLHTSSLQKVSFSSEIVLPHLVSQFRYYRPCKSSVT